MENTIKILKPEIIEFPQKETLTDRQIDNRIRKLSELEKEAKKLKKEIEEIKNEIKSVMNSEEIRTTKWVIRNTEYESEKLDTKRLKEEHAALCAEYVKTVKSSRFSYKEA